MEDDALKPGPPTGDGWDKRLPYWQRRLGRLRLGAEPIEAQLTRYRRATWVLSIIVFAMAAFIVALFTAFRRPGIGLVFALVLFGPIGILAWIDYGLLRWRANRFERERREHETWRTSWS
jgi:hypothetical protein